MLHFATVRADHIHSVNTLWSYYGNICPRSWESRDPSYHSAYSQNLLRSGEAEALGNSVKRLGYCGTGVCMETHMKGIVLFIFISWGLTISEVHTSCDSGTIFEYWCLWCWGLSFSNNFLILCACVVGVFFLSKVHGKRLAVAMSQSSARQIRRSRQADWARWFTNKIVGWWWPRFSLPPRTYFIDIDTTVSKNVSSESSESSTSTLQSPKKQQKKGNVSISSRGR